VKRRWTQLTFGTRALIVCVASLILSIVVVALAAIPLTPDVAIRTSLPLVAALIALVSLTSSAIGAAANASRQRREATLKAYSEWSDTTWDTRKKLQMRLGNGVLDEGLAAEIVGAPRAGRTLPKHERISVASDIATVLNGLERLAVGVELGVYDLVTLRRLAGTIVVRHWQRYESYVMARRKLATATDRQKVVFLSLENVAAELEALHAKEDKRALDEERLIALESQPSVPDGAPGPP